jgi:hypothetical protein
MTDYEKARHPATVKKIYLREKGLQDCKEGVVGDLIAEFAQRGVRNLQDVQAVIRQKIAKQVADDRTTFGGGYEPTSGRPRTLASEDSVWGDAPKPWYQNSLSALGVVVIDAAQNHGLHDPKNPNFRAASIPQPVDGSSSNGLPAARKREKDWNGLSAYLDMNKHADLILVDRSDAETVAKAHRRLQELTKPMPRDLAKDK